MFGTRPTNLQITTSSIMRAQRANCPVRQDAPSRYRLRRVVSRSVLPRERFRPVARNGHADHVARGPLSGAKRKTYARIELFRFLTPDFGLSLNEPRLNSYDLLSLASEG